MLDFVPFQKIARLSREIVVTEKLDGTNAQVNIEAVLSPFNPNSDRDSTVLDFWSVAGMNFVMRTGSRTKWITPNANGEQNDNYGFAAWAVENCVELRKLGPGAHYGEWWGQGIQRKYNAERKHFSLFNVNRWDDDEVRPVCCDVVPTLYRGAFTTEAIEHTLDWLCTNGSAAAENFMNPEGVVIYHTASGELFKKTILKDEMPKGMTA